MCWHRTEEIEQLLIKLRKFVLTNPEKKAADQPPPSKDTRDRRGEEDNRTSSKAREEVAEVDPYPEARLEELDDYLEMLYQVAGKSEKEKEEGIRLQVQATAMILKVCSHEA